MADNNYKHEGGRVLLAKSSVLGQNEKFGLSYGGAEAVARLDVDGQNGFSTDFRYLNANTPYVKQRTLCFVLEVPAFFKYIGNNGREITRAFKSIMENKTEKISGLDSSIKAEYTQVNIGPTEVFDAFTRSTREKSEPTHTLTDLYGRAISTFFETWIVMGLGDPITNIPGVVTSRKYLEEIRGRNAVNGQHIYTLMPENVAATCIYIEPDPTMTFAVNAWLCTNMMPDNAGDRQGEMDRTSAPDKQEITIKFTCVQEVNSGVKVLANNVLQALEIRGMNSVDRRAYIGDDYWKITTAKGNGVEVNPGKSETENSPYETGAIHQNYQMAHSEHVNAMRHQFGGSVPNEVKNGSQSDKL